MGREQEYKDIDGNVCTLGHLIRTDPAWAENRHLVMLDHIDFLESRRERCKFCGQEVADGLGGHTSRCYEDMLNEKAALLERCRERRDKAVEGLAAVLRQEQLPWDIDWDGLAALLEDLENS